MNTAANRHIIRIIRILVIAFLISSTFLVSRPAAVKAAPVTHTLYVDIISDYDFGPNGASTCANPAVGQFDCSLRGAIARANWQLDDLDPLNDSDLFVIDMLTQYPGGVSYLNLDPNPSTAYGEDGNLKGDLDIRGNVQIVGSSNPANIVIDARQSSTGESLDRVFDIQPGASAEIQGVTIQYGFAHGIVTINSRNFPEPGGGIRNRGTLTISNTIVSNNRTNNGLNSPGGYGGGIYNTGTINANTLTVENNYTGGGNGTGSNEGGGGGGIFNDTSGILNMQSSTIRTNHTGPGGPAYSGGAGGGLYNNNLAVLNSVNFEANYSGDGTAGIPEGGTGGNGGAIFNNIVGDLNIEGGTFIDNTTGKGALGQNTTGSGGIGGDGGKGGAISNSGTISKINNVNFEGNDTGPGGDCSYYDQDAPGEAGNGGAGGAISNGQYGTIGNGTATAIIFTMNHNHTGAGGKCDGTGTGGPGGGISNEGTINSPLQVEITNNTTGPGGEVLLPNYIQGGDGGNGGGIYNLGIIRYQGSSFQLGIDHSTITGNGTGAGGKGGDGPLSGVSYGGNGGDGGGIFNLGTIAAIRFTTLEENSTGTGNGTFLANSPDRAGNGGDGGAIYNTGGITEISYSLLLHNSTGNGGESNPSGFGGFGGSGGAIALFSYGEISKLFNSTLTGNSTGTGGRGANESHGAGGNGGGIYIQESGWIDIRMTTLFDNKTPLKSYTIPSLPGTTLYIDNAGHGAGIFVLGAELVSVVGSIISDNPRDILNGSGLPATQGSDCSKMPGDGLQSLGFNVIRNPLDDHTVEDANYQCGVFITSAGKFGPDITGQDPKLSALTSGLGDPTQYFIPAFDENNPSANSPAIDLVPMKAGSIPLCGVLDNQSSDYKDQRAHHRPEGSRCDAGSVEIGGMGGEFTIFLPTVLK